MDDNDTHIDVTRRSVLRAAGALGVGATLSAGTAAGAGQQESDWDTSCTGAKPDLDAVDPRRFDYEDAIVEYEHIPTRTGAEAWVDVIRPDTDEPVPTIMIASPYYNTLGRGWKRELKEPHQGPEAPTSPGFPGLSPGEAVPFPEWYDEYFVERGYAVALMDLRGTRNSSGCQEYGDRDEVYDVVDAIDALVERPWSNGAFGMTGGSYDGTIATGAAAEMPLTGQHPDALKAIIPIRAIGRWYDYAFVNGAQIAGQSLVTPSLFTELFPAGDTQNSGTDDTFYPLHVVERKACMGTFGAAVSAGHASPYQDARREFWRERSFTKNAASFRAATFAIHGIFDYNVKTQNVGYLWERLPAELPKKLWLYNGKHGDPAVPEEEGGAKITHPFREKFLEATHRWFYQFLKGEEAGALVGPEFEVQRADGSWDDGGTYPAATRDRTLYFNPDGTVSENGGDGGSVAYADGASTAPDSRTFVTDPLDSATRLSGQLGFEFPIVADGTDATVAVSVLDLPPGASPDEEATVKHTPGREKPLQASYAWVRAWYRDDVPMRGLSTPSTGEPLDPGSVEQVKFGSLYTDLVVPAGHRLAFRVSNAAGGTLGSDLGGTVRLLCGPGGSRVNLPVAPLSSPRC
jgi:X-Pro dipeptidyl-peptidase